MAAAAILSAALTLALTACIHIPLPGESSDGMTNSLDTETIAGAVTATSDDIESTEVETSLDGLTTHLYVRPVIATDGLTASQLDAVLRVAYEQSEGRVASIEVRTVDASDEPVDLTAAAGELGIQHLDNVDSVTYSTAHLERAYGE